MGEKIRRRREFLGWKIDALAHRLMVDVVAIEKMETRKLIAIKLLRRIASAMQIEVRDIIELSEEEFVKKHRNKIAEQVNARYWHLDDNPSANKGAR